MHGRLGVDLPDTCQLPGGVGLVGSKEVLTQTSRDRHGLAL